MNSFSVFSIGNLKMQLCNNYSFQKNHYLLITIHREKYVIYIILYNNCH